MFLRRMGRKILLLHNYRDGAGKVRQQRLGDFAGAQDAACQLRDEKWLQELKALYPDFRFDQERLLERARTLQDKPPPQRVQKARSRNLHHIIERTLLTLQRLLEKAQDPELERRVVQQLTRTSRAKREVELRAWVRATQPPRRSCWHRDDPAAAAHRQAMQQVVEHFEGAGQFEEACVAQAELARAFPDQQAWLDHGVLLQRLGRWDEAILEYSRLPYRDSLRHYQIASAVCAKGNPEESLEHVFRALTWDRDVAEGLLKIEKGLEPTKGAEYWQRLGRLWTPAGRKFLLAVYNQSLVKMGLGRAARRGIKPRRLFRGHAVTVILGQARDGVAYRKLPVTREIIDF